MAWELEVGLYHFKSNLELIRTTLWCRNDIVVADIHKMWFRIVVLQHMKMFRTTPFTKKMYRTFTRSTCQMSGVQHQYLTWFQISLPMTDWTFFVGWDALISSYVMIFLVFVCLSVCVSVNKIPEERIHQFWCVFC